MLGQKTGSCFYILKGGNNSGLKLAALRDSIAASMLYGGLLAARNKSQCSHLYSAIERYKCLRRHVPTCEYDNAA